MRRTAYYYARHSGRCAYETISRRCQFVVRQRVKSLLKPVIDRALRVQRSDKKLFPLYARIACEISHSVTSATLFPPEMYECVCTKVLMFISYICGIIYMLLLRLFLHISLLHFIVFRRTPCAKESGDTQCISEHHGIYLSNTINDVIYRGTTNHGLIMSSATKTNSQSRL